MAARGSATERLALVGVPLALIAVAGMGLYVLAFRERPVSQPQNPSVLKEIRVSGSSSSSGDVTPPQVTAVSPAPNSTVTSSPTEVTVTFNEAVEPATINTSTLRLLRSGGDDSFSEGNEVQIIPQAVELLSPTQACLTLAGPVPNDLYRVVVYGGGAPGTIAWDEVSSTSTSGGSASSTTSGTSGASTSTSSSTSATSNSTSSTASTSTSTTSGATSASGGASSLGTSSGNGNFGP